jgi:high-affinity iron transporter
MGLSTSRITAGLKSACRPGREWWRPIPSLVSAVTLALAGLGVLLVPVWQGITAFGNPNPLAAPLGSTAAVFDIGVLVFREGLECTLVLAAVTAGRVGAGAAFRTPIAAGAGAAFICTLITWRVAVSLVDDLTTRMSALTLQAATGLVAVLVLLVVMNWFFHRVYWAGWISAHTRKKQAIMLEARRNDSRKTRLRLGLALLGFTAFYREGFEVVLFLQSYRMKLGERPVFLGVLIGMLSSGVIAVLTFIAHRRLPYRKMLVLTGILLGGVLLVMVGEQAQEMQLAHWLPRTDLPALAGIAPPWIGVWLSVFPTVETLAAQCIAAALVLGSYFAARSETPRSIETRI